jgi:hypothetical protein
VRSFLSYALTPIMCSKMECLFAVYISGKPFVLRDGSVPKTTLALSDRAENLEGIEDRLKSDILKEAKKWVFNANICCLFPSPSLIELHPSQVWRPYYDTRRTRRWDFDENLDCDRC